MELENVLTSGEKSFKMEELDKILEYEINNRDFGQINEVLSQEVSDLAKKKNSSQEFHKEKEEIEDEDESEYEFILKDNFKACSKIIKQKYTIKTKLNKKDYIERFAFCKTKGCKAKAQLRQYASKTELYYNNKPHLQICEQNQNIFYHEKVQEYLEQGMKPKDVISKFNKLGIAKIEVNKDNCRKLSQLKYALNSKKKEEMPIVTNPIELESWLEQKFYFHSNDGTFESLPWDAPFVVNYKIENQKFLALISTKNCLLNFIKQSACDNSLLCLDGTYKHNVEGFPTIVIGTCDLHKHFHLGNLKI